ncbi:MAG: hypothetical protein AAF799_04995 [Myxococcota bacterium]
MTVEGTTLTVETSATITELGKRACTDDCRAVLTDCEVPKLAPGTYTLQYGDPSSSFTVPDDTEVCVGRWYLASIPLERFDR